jgi:hypothetical protein
MHSNNFSRGVHGHTQAARVRCQAALRLLYCQTFLMFFASLHFMRRDESLCLAIFVDLRVYWNSECNLSRAGYVLDEEGLSAIS